jgi:hypothetical protein
MPWSIKEDMPSPYDKIKKAADDFVRRGASGPGPKRQPTIGPPDSKRDKTGPKPLVQPTPK